MQTVVACLRKIGYLLFGRGIRTTVKQWVMALATGRLHMTTFASVQSLSAYNIREDNTVQYRTVQYSAVLKVTVHRISQPSSVLACRACSTLRPLTVQHVQN